MNSFYPVSSVPCFQMYDEETMEKIKKEGQDNLQKLKDNDTN
tara:strand:+ start:205 stop:330 length:126 start_codon:yes stop_codon:yes gene_type:complete